MKYFVTNNLEKILVGIAMLLSLVSIIYVMSIDASNANGDSIARLNIARRVFDSTSPGFAQIGYVWLPIGSILMLPLIWMDSFYYTGLAGILFSAIAFVWASYAVYRIGQIIAGTLAGIFSYLFFVLNPNILYMQATSLSEIFYASVILGALYYMLLWARDHKDTHLIASAAFFFLATLSRYDGWVLAFIALGTIGIYVYLMTRHWGRAEGAAILFGVVAFFGPLLWFAWNYAIFENPIYFAVGEYSAKYQQASLLANNLLPSRHNLENAFFHTFYAGGMVMGWSIVTLGVIGFLYSLAQLLIKRRLRYIFPLILAAQVFYYILNLYSGNGVIFVPQLFPFEMHNIRYAITFVPFFAIAAGLVAARSKLIGATLALLVLFEYGLIGATGNVITLNESLYGFAGRQAHESRINAGVWLKDNYDGGLLLIDIFDNDSVAFYSRIPLERWINVGDPKIFERAITYPESSAEWILIREADKLSGAFSGGQTIENNFTCVYKNDDIKIYKRQIEVSTNTFSACDNERLAHGDTTF